MQNLLNALSDAMPKLGPQMRRAARHVLDDPGSIALTSMRSVAASAGVSPPTMLRLAQRLGYDTYDSFRDVFKAAVAGRAYSDRATELGRTTDADGTAGLIGRTAGAANDALARFLEPAFATALEDIAEAMIAAPRTFVAASGALFGNAVGFHYVCRMALPGVALAGGPGLRPVDAVTTINADDMLLAITTAPYARETVDAAALAKRRGARVAGITDARTAPLTAHCDTIAVVGTDSPHYFPSTIALTAALEALSALVAVKCGADAVEAIADVDRGLRDNAYYWTSDT